jgi:hypothetical protein
MDSIECLLGLREETVEAEETAKPTVLIMLTRSDRKVTHGDER